MASRELPTLSASRLMSMHETLTDDRDEIDSALSLIRRVAGRLLCRRLLTIRRRLRSWWDRRRLELELLEDVVKQALGEPQVAHGHRADELGVLHLPSRKEDAREPRVRRA